MLTLFFGNMLVFACVFDIFIWSARVLFSDGFLSESLGSKDLTATVLGLIKERRPGNVKQLAGLLKERVNLSEREIIDLLLKLQAEGVISFEDPGVRFVSPLTYLKSGRVLWFWLTIVLQVVTCVFIVFFPGVYPWALVQNLLGVVFVLVLPGYAFVRFLFPVKAYSTISEGQIEKLKRTVLSLGASIALVSIVGLLLYYVDGLDLVWITLSLFALTSFFAIAALVREYSQVR